MTNQEAMDIMVTHLLKQNAKAATGSDGYLTCLYRAPEGKQCAVGCLIPDDQYYELLEDMNLHDVIPEVDALQGVSYGLLTDMQNMHDQEEPKLWRDQMEDIALAHGLKFNP